MSTGVPEIHRIADESPVTWGDAMHAWVAPAYAALQQTAETYHATISAARLAATVQGASGIGTTARVGEWLPRLLSRISKKALQDRLPPLTSLCVNDDGTVFDGYASWIRLPGADEPPASADAHAAADRLACYQRFAADLPPDGGEPGPMPTVVVVAPVARAPRGTAGGGRASGGSGASGTAPRAPRRAVAPKQRGIDAAKARRKAEDEPPKVCANCFTQLPASGVCDYCG